jgi:hypothetical protein
MTVTAPPMRFSVMVIFAVFSSRKGSCELFLPLSVRRPSVRPSVRPLIFHILINSSEATGPIWTKSISLGVNPWPISPLVFRPLADNEVLDWDSNVIQIFSFLAHLTQRVMWAIAITWRPSSSPSSSSVVRRKLFQKCSPLKVLDQWKPKLCPVMPCTNQHGRCY